MPNIPGGRGTVAQFFSVANIRIGCELNLIPLWFFFWSTLMIFWSTKVLFNVFGVGQCVHGCTSRDQCWRSPPTSFETRSLVDPLRDPPVPASQCCPSWCVPLHTAFLHGFWDLTLVLVLPKEAPFQFSRAILPCPFFLYILMLEKWNVPIFKLCDWLVD